MWMYTKATLGPLGVLAVISMPCGVLLHIKVPDQNTPLQKSFVEPGWTAAVGLPPDSTLL